MSLDEYHNKRQFSKTPEPEAESDRSDLNRFVVQRHEASRLHYDLRLEIDGVLKSWAVPKGPSMNASDKRLAIQTEDHPVKYLFFEGDIPKGNYGAGHMDIWDSGKFEILEDGSEIDALKQFNNGDLKLKFFGDKLQGDFALVRTNRKEKQVHWLLIKKKDQYATGVHYDAENLVEHKNSENPPKIRNLDLKGFTRPMLAETAEEIFSDPDWIYEAKWDGYRIIAQIENGKVELFSRNGQSYKIKFQPVSNELEQIAHTAILDGEMVLVDEEGRPHFQWLQNYESGKGKGVLRYYVFDLLHLNGHDTLELPLIDRKSLIPELLEGLDSVLYCEHLEGMGKAFYERAIENGLEGVIAKKKDSCYYPGYRTKDWLKIKAVADTDAFICGYTESESPARPFGSLILGQLRENELNYIGNCGSGFSAKTQEALFGQFQELVQDENPFPQKINLKGRKAIWMRPELLCTIQYSEWTENGLLRHPVFKALRTEIMKKNNQKPKNQKKSSDSSSNLEIDGINVPVTNLEKVYWPDANLTKYDLLDYYIKMADYLVPYLKDRPESLHRHPNGINEDSFFQKDTEYLPEWIETYKLWSKSSNRDIDYLLCQNPATLIYMANLGCIEINPWNSRIQSLDRPDYTVIDIDPSDSNTFQQVLETARVAGTILNEAEIRFCCKTTGKSGLHIYLPLNGEYTYDEARTFTQLICTLINEELPDLTSMERNLKKRGKKIYLDYLQNRRGQTLASVYSARPVKGATVSTPVSWKEIQNGFKKEEFTIKTVPDRIAEIGDIFSSVLDEAVDIEKSLDKLAR